MTGDARTMTDTRRYALATDAVLEQRGDEALILKLTNETMFSLNATGARIVALLVKGLDAGTIVTALADQYHASPSDIEPDVLRLIDALVSGGLIEAAGQPESR